MLHLMTLDDLVELENSLPHRDCDCALCQSQMDRWLEQKKGKGVAAEVAGRRQAEGNKQEP